MRISELSRRTDVPVATIKFYLREHLLPEGERTSATQAQYGEAHVERLRLVRALTGAGGLSVAAVRQVLAAIETPPADPYDLICAAGSAVARRAERVDHTRLHALMTEWGVDLAAEACETHADLAAALHAMEAAGSPMSAADLQTYRDQMQAIARYEIDGVPTGAGADAVRYVVLGTVLVEPVLLALRRLGHRELTAQRFRPQDSAAR